MAIALRGSAVIPTGGQQNPTTGYTCTIPSQVVAGDLLFLTLTSRDSTGAGAIAVADNGEAGGWTNFGHSSTDYKLTLWWKRATANSASATLTVSGCVGSCSGVLKAFSGAWAGAANPYMDVTFSTNASGTETQTGFTPSINDGMVCCAVTNYANDNAVTSLSFATLGATTATECLSTGGSDCGNIFGHALQTGAPAATGNLTWAQTDGTTYSAVWTIRPVAPAIVTTSLNATASGGSLRGLEVVALTGLATTSNRGDLSSAVPTAPHSGPIQFMLASGLYLNDATNYSYAIAGSYVAGTSGGSAVSVALTGQEATSAQGALSPRDVVALAGQEAASQQGLPSAAAPGALVGQQASSEQGALGVSHSQAVGAANLLTDTQALDAPSWTTAADNTTVTANATTAPDASSTAEKLIPTVTNDVHNIEQAVATLDDSVNYTLSVYAKPAGYDWVELVFRRKNNSSAAVTFNVSTGVVGSVVTNAAAYGIEAVGSGWYRCWLIADSATGATAPVVQIWPMDADAAFAFAGNGTDGVYAWEPRFEKGSVATVSRGTLSGLSGQSAALTGLEFTSAQGAFTTRNAVTLTGQQATAERGTLSPPVTIRSYVVGPGIYLNDVNSYSYAVAGAYVIGTGIAASGPVTVSLTGLAATATVGSIASRESVPLVGQQITIAQGGLAGSVPLIPAGQAATVSRGTITPSFSVPIEEAHEAEVPGLQATTAQSVLSVLVSRAFVGQVATVSRGAFISAQTQAIAGQEITASAGSATGQHANTGTLVGLGASCAGGEIAAAHANALTGQAGIVQQGDVTASLVNTAALVGQQATAQADSVATQHTNALTGHEAAAESGAPSAGSAGSSTLNGLEASGEVGALRPDHRNEIAGLQAATERGELAAISSVAPTLTGLQTAAEVGTFGVRHANALIGAETSTAEGSITAGPAGLLSGQQLTTQAGSVGVIHSNSLTGLEVVGTQGALSAGSAGASMLNGLQAASALGVLRPDQSSALAGLEASTARGDLSAVATTGVTLTGQAATSAQGALGTLHSNALTGQPCITQQGTIGASYPVSVAATGQQAAVTAGQTTPTVVVSLQGHSLTLVQGSLSQEAAAVVLVGRGATVSSGVLDVHMEGEEELGGVQAVALQGELFPELEVSLEENEVELVGLEATVQQGQLRAFGGTLLFVDPKFRNMINGRQWCNTDDGREWSNAA